MQEKNTNKIVLFLKRIIKSVKNFQDFFRLLEALASLVFFYFTRKKLPIM